MTSSIALIARVRALKKLREQRREERRIRERNRAAGIKPAPGSVQALSTESVLHEFADKPVEFIREILGYELEIQLPPGSLTFPNRGQREGICDYQARIARALLKHNKVAVRSGHKLGKSLVAILLAIWWVCTRDEGRVVLTAATDRQVKRVLWRELRNVCRRLKRRGIKLIPEPKLDPATGCQWADGREIIGFSTKIPENAAGFSGSAVLFILDEGSGIPTEIYEAFAGNMAGGAKLIALSNPTQTVGWFFEAFGIRRGFWHLEHLSIEDSPNYRAGADVVPGMAQRSYAEEIAEAYGKDSPFYQVRVAGNFPLNVPNAVIGLGIVEAARARWVERDHDGNSLDIGVDVARFGDDDSAVAGRRGLSLFSPRWFEDNTEDVRAVVHGYDSKKVTGVVLQCMRALREPGERVRIKIDAAGGYGGAVADELRAQQEAGELDEFIDIIEVNVAESSGEPDKYPRLRDELWFAGRKYFKPESEGGDGGALYPDPKLESELIAPRYAPTAKGQFAVEPKTETKKQLGRSPDRADAVLLAIYEPAMGFESVEDDDSDDDSWNDSESWADVGERGYGAPHLPLRTENDDTVSRHSAVWRSQCARNLSARWRYVCRSHRPEGAGAGGTLRRHALPARRPDQLALRPRQLARRHNREPGAHAHCGGPRRSMGARGSGLRDEAGLRLQHGRCSGALHRPDWPEAEARAHLLGGHDLVHGRRHAGDRPELEQCGLQYEG